MHMSCIAMLATLPGTLHSYRNVIVGGSLQELDIYISMAWRRRRDGDMIG